MSAELVNELVIYFAPCLLGAQARGMFDLPELRSLADRRMLQITEARMIGPDLRIIAEPAPSLQARTPRAASSNC